MSMTGPTLRAAGLSYDNRRVFPYSSYEEFQSTCPRAGFRLLRALYDPRREMRESLKIIRQASTKSRPTGLSGRSCRHHPSDREKMKTEMEALIYHFKIFTEGFRPHLGKRSLPSSLRRGELGVSWPARLAKPLRLHFRGRRSLILQALAEIDRGQANLRVIACIGTIDIVLGEDR